MNNLFAIGIFLAVGMVSAQDREGVGEAAPYKSDQEKHAVIEALEQSWNGVNRWSIEYEVTPLFPKATVIPVHKVMAISADGDFYESVGHITPASSWRIDPFDQELFIHRGVSCLNSPFNRAFFEEPINPGDFFPGTSRLDLLLGLLPRWPNRTYRMPSAQGSASPSILIDALNSPEYRLLSHAETVDAEECLVLENRLSEKIWLAQNRGGSLMKREVRDAKSGELTEQYITEDFFQVIPGLWLPRTLRVQSFQGAHSKETLVREVKIRILACRLNAEVPDSTFIIGGHPAGSARYNNEGEFTQVVPGGTDLLTRLIEFMTTNARLPSKPVEHESFLRWLSLGLASGAALAGGFLLWSVSSTGQRSRLGGRGLPDSQSALR